MTHESISKDLFIKKMGDRIEVINVWDCSKIILDRTEAYSLSRLLRDWSTEK